MKSERFVYECNIDHDSASEKLWVHGRTNFETFKTLIKTLPYVDAASIDHKHPGFMSMFLLAFLENLESREFDFHLWEQDGRLFFEHNSEPISAMEFYARDTRMHLGHSYSKLHSVLKNI